MATPRRTVLRGIAVAGAAAVAGCSRAITRTSRPSQAGSPNSSPAPTAMPSSTAARRVTPAVAAPRGPARQVVHGSRRRPEVALTFHGAGEPALARELLEIFAAHRAHVTVLAVGRWLHRYPDMAGRIVEAGHELGNHTYHHLAIDELPPDQARAEIVRCRDLLVSLVGSPGAHFRQSQAARATALVRRLAGAAGYPVCLSYDVDSLDYTDPGPRAVRANVARARAGSIVSMHFGHVGTVEAMPRILDDLAARGLRPVTAATLLRV